MNSEIYLIEPVTFGVINDCYKVIHNFLLDNGYNPVVINSYNGLDNQEQNIKIDGGVVVLFTVFLKSLRDNKKNCRDHIKNANVVFINTESMFVSRWQRWFNLLNSLTNIKCVFDYTYKNINLFKKLLPKVTTGILCPLFHTDYIVDLYSLKKIESANSIDLEHIDILFFGTINDRRQLIKDRLLDYFKNRDLSIVFCFDLENTLYYSKRAKIVLVVHRQNQNLPIDYYRIFQLIVNKIFIIHEDVQLEDKNSLEYNLLSKSLIFSPYDKMCETCDKYLGFTQDERDEICGKTFNTFKNDFNMKHKLTKLTNFFDAFRQKIGN